MTGKRPSDYKILPPFREVSVSIDGGCATIKTHRNCCCIDSKTVRKFSLLAIITGKTWEDRINAAKSKMKRKAEYLDKIQFKSKVFESKFND